MYKALNGKGYGLFLVNLLFVDNIRHKKPYTINSGDIPYPQKAVDWMEKSSC